MPKEICIKNGNTQIKLNEKQIVINAPIVNITISNEEG